MKVSKYSFEDRYPQRSPSVDNLFKSMMTSYIPQTQKIFRMGSIVFAAGTEYSSGRVTLRHARRACIEFKAKPCDDPPTTALKTHHFCNKIVYTTVKTVYIQSAH